MGNFFAGKSASFTYNTVAYPGKSFSIDIENGIVETTNFTSGGWKEFISGLASARFTINMPFDPTVAQIAQGSTLTNANFAISSTHYIIFNAIVSRIRPSTSVEGAAMLDIEGTSTGVANVTFT